MDRAGPAADRRRTATLFAAGVAPAEPGRGGRGGPRAGGPGVPRLVRRVPGPGKSRPAPPTGRLLGGRRGVPDSWSMPARRPRPRTFTSALLLEQQKQFQPAAASPHPGHRRPQTRLRVRALHRRPVPAPDGRPGRGADRVRDRRAHPPELRGGPPGTRCPASPRTASSTKPLDNSNRQINWPPRTPGPSSCSMTCARSSPRRSDA